jgi:hypothetical protein
MLKEEKVKIKKAQKNKQVKPKDQKRLPKGQLKRRISKKVTIKVESSNQLKTICKSFKVIYK